MSDTETTEEIRSILKKSLIVGDLHTVENILRHHPEAFTQTEMARLMRLVERVKFGTTTPVQDPELMVIASKL